MQKQGNEPSGAVSSTSSGTQGRVGNWGKHKMKTEGEGARRRKTREKSPGKKPGVEKRDSYRRVLMKRQGKMVCAWSTLGAEKKK